MSAEAGPSQPPTPQPQVGKKRKRTGKEREERKQAAILAAAQAKVEDAETEPGAGSHETGPENVKAPESKAVEGPVVDFEALEKRLPRALTHLRHVFKKAKTIEMTRLIRKIKHLRTKPEAKTEMEDLEAQRQLLAHIDLVSTLSAHLLTNLRKHRFVKRSSAVLPPAVVEQLEASTETTSSPANDLRKKVENRLCSSKAAAQEMKNAIAWLMGEEGAKLGVSTPAVKTPEAGTKGKNSQARKAKATTTSLAMEDEDEAESEGDDEAGDMSISRRVAVDSDDEEEGDDGAGWESGSVSGNDDPTPSLRQQPVLADSESDDDDDESVPVTRAPKSKKTKTEAKPAPAPAKAAKGKALTSSTFLPSLSTGFTRGDSDDSDPDDDFGEGLEDVIGKQKAGPRKNRRGQQARRLIWERKYGKNAKHVQKAQAQETEGNIANAYGKRASAGAAKSTSNPAESSTARDFSNTTKPTPPAAPAPRPYVPSSQPRAAPPSSAVPAAGSTGLHPSWEAARLRKQKEAAGPKATKIVFD